MLVLTMLIHSEEEARAEAERKDREEIERLEQEKAYDDSVTCLTCSESFLVSGKLKSIQNRRAKAREKLDLLLSQQATLDDEKQEQKGLLATVR